MKIENEQALGILQTERTKTLTDEYKNIRVAEGYRAAFDLAISAIQINEKALAECKVRIEQIYNSIPETEDTDYLIERAKMETYEKILKILEETAGATCE